MADHILTSPFPFAFHKINTPHVAFYMGDAR